MSRLSPNDHQGVNQASDNRAPDLKARIGPNRAQTAHRLKVLSKQVIHANQPRAVDEHDQKSQPLHYHVHLKVDEVVDD